MNALRGRRMSLVGPQPPLRSEVALYGERRHARFDVKPGITGSWQVAGRNWLRWFERLSGWRARSSRTGRYGRIFSTTRSTSSMRI